MKSFLMSVVALMMRGWGWVYTYRMNQFVSKVWGTLYSIWVSQFIGEVGEHSQIVIANGVQNGK